jgi:hypothetical protein
VTASRKRDRRNMLVARQRRAGKEHGRHQDDRRLARCRCGGDDATEGTIRRVDGNAMLRRVACHVRICTALGGSLDPRVRQRGEHRDEELEDGRKDEADAAGASTAHYVEHKHAAAREQRNRPWLRAAIIRA